MARVNIIQSPPAQSRQKLALFSYYLHDITILQCKYDSKPIMTLTPFFAPWYRKSNIQCKVHCRGFVKSIGYWQVNYIYHFIKIKTFYKQIVICRNKNINNRLILMLQKILYLAPSRMGNGRYLSDCT